jgi:hypothetical protein
MTVFFLVVGMEIRREMHQGSLEDIRLAALPLAAAVGGVLVPALLYVALNSDVDVRRGSATWAARSSATCGEGSVMSERPSVASASERSTAKSERGPSGPLRSSRSGRQ